MKVGHLIQRIRAKVPAKIALAVLVIVTIPVIVWAQWTTSSNNIYNSNSGNVGVGTTTPGVKLDIVGQLRSTQHLRLPAESGYDWWLGAFTDYDSWQLTHANNSTGSWWNALTVLTNGNVGVGTTSPDSKLTVVSGSDGFVALTLADNEQPSTLSSLGTLLGGSITSNMTGGNGEVDFINRFASSNAGPQGFRFYQQTATGAFSHLMLLDGDTGNVGIGTTSPSSKLDVNGDVTVSGNISAKYQDIAEWVPSVKRFTPGTVVVQDSNGINTVIASTEPYDTRVAGVVSATPGIVLGEAGEGKVKVATTGRVKVRVEAYRAPVRSGDLLVTSDKEGVAMRSEAVNFGGVEMHRPGTLIGKALEPLAGGEGEILVLLSLQ